MIIENFKGFGGQHCESNATGCLLKNAGLELSEPMLIGLGQAFGFIYWKMRIMNLPFLGGRSKPFALTQTLCTNLGLDLDARETTSSKKAWSNITDFVDRGVPIALQLDCYHLEYFSEQMHFAGHFLCVYGYDRDKAYICDTAGMQTTSLQSLEKARFEKGPMSAKARSWTISVRNKRPALKKIIPEAIKAVAGEFLNPAINNFGYAGIRKLGKEIVRWLDLAPHPEKDLAESAEVMERGGTGGALFRNLYRDFLKESLEHLPGNRKIEEAGKLYGTAAELWTEIAILIQQAGATGGKEHLKKASALCYKVADLEKEAMEHLIHL